MKLSLAGALAVLALPLCAADNPLESIDTAGYSAAQKKVLASVLVSRNCTCGCSWTIAKCRADDPKCGVSRSLLNMIIKDLKAGKNETQIIANLKAHENDPPPVLDVPVALNTMGDPVIGAANAKVTIVEFSDFQCPYCAQAVEQARAILQRYPKDVRLVFKQFPLDNHSQAFVAAEAALAAHAQGKFWEMHDKLYGDWKNINPENIKKWAQEIGLDMTRFSQEMAAGKYKKNIENEMKQGEDAGVQGTPSFFFNGRKYSGAFQADAVGQMLASEFKVTPR